MKQREHRPDHAPTAQAAPRRDRAVAPGKRTLTMGLASRHPSGAAVVQRRPAMATAPGMPPRSGAAEGPMEDWMAVALRPDLHQAPILRKSMNEVGYAGDAGATPAASNGQPMPAAVQAKMESAFGADFSAVRIHQGPEAQQMGALAYTQGPDIHFAPGQYDPGNQRGQELLGHELTHVVQQSQGRVRAPSQAKGVGINADASLEREADEMGARVAQGERASGAALVPAAIANAPASTTVQRKLERRGEESGFVHFVDTRDTRIKPPLVFRQVGEQSFIEMNSQETVTYLPGTDQFLIGTPMGSFLNPDQPMSYFDPVSHRRVKFDPNLKAYTDDRGSCYVYEGNEYRPVPEATLAQQALQIDQRSRSEGGIWTVGCILLDGRVGARTEPARHGVLTTHNNPYSKTHLQHYECNQEEVHRSRSDAEVTTLHELEGLMKHLIDTETQAPEDVRVVITGNMGPCDECKLRIDAFAKRVQGLVNKAQHTKMRQFGLYVESRYLTQTTRPIQGERDTTYGYPEDQRIMTGGMVAYRKYVAIDTVQ